MNLTPTYMLHSKVIFVATKFPLIPKCTQDARYFKIRYFSLSVANLL